MTTPNDHTDTDDSPSEQRGGRRAILGLAGAGIAGAAVLGKGGLASATDGDNVEVGGDYTGNTATRFTNDTATEALAGPANALKGTISSADNDSHTILGTTVGGGHAIAGVVGTPTTPTDNGVGATWGRHYGPGAAVEGQSKSKDQPLAGPANGVKGVIDETTNGSHAVLGITQGAGHAVAGDIPAGTGNTVGATWGRHAGNGAGAEGVNTATDVPLAGPAHGVKGTVEDATNGSHAVLGVTNGAGHSIAGDTPAGDNTVAATWGRHGGAGAGIGGVSADGYGGEFVGGRAHVRLIQDEDETVSGPPSTGMHKIGELYADGAGALFYNQGEGSQWTRLSQQTFLNDNPVRVYDSRPGEKPETSQKGKTTDTEVRTIDISEFVDTSMATAAIINLSITETDGGGFLTVFNADTADEDEPGTSSINWYTEGMTIGNAQTVRLSSDGKIKVRSTNSTHFVIDVTGVVA